MKLPKIIQRLFKRGTPIIPTDENVMKKIIEQNKEKK